MQGGRFPLKNHRPPLAEFIDEKYRQIEVQGGQKKVANLLENSVLDLVVSDICCIFVVQKERERVLPFGRC